MLKSHFLFRFRFLFFFCFFLITLIKVDLTRIILTFSFSWMRPSTRVGSTLFSYFLLSIPPFNRWYTNKDIFPVTSKSEVRRRHYHHEGSRINLLLFLMNETFNRSQTNTTFLFPFVQSSLITMVHKRIYLSHHRKEKSTLFSSPT